MIDANTLKKLTICSLTTVMCGAGQGVLAHTGIKDQATEAKGLYTGFTITHGCGTGEGATTVPVKAQSAVFPNASDSVAMKIDPVTFAETVIDLATVITGAIGGVTSLAPGGIQDRNVFKEITEIPDALGNVRAIDFTDGNLNTTLVGVIPFRVSGVNFAPTSCAKSLKVRIAVANFCTKSKGLAKDNRADVWIGHMTPLFNDPGVMPNDFETKPYWPTLTVGRDLVANPFPANCKTVNGVTGYDVAVEPSDADMDANLPIKGYWPKP